MKQAGFPIPLWLLLIDTIGVGLLLLGVLALFADVGDSLGAFGDPVAAAACLVVGVVLIGGSAVHIVLHLRAREAARERGKRE